MIQMRISETMKTFDIAVFWAHSTGKKAWHWEFKTW